MKKQTQKTENKTQVAPNFKANRLSFSSSIVFQTTTIVNAPSKAGKNFTQNTSFPSSFITSEIQELNGGTDKKPTLNGRLGEDANIRFVANHSLG